MLMIYFFTQLEQIILEFIQSHEKLWIDKAILRKKKRRKQKLSSAETSVQFSRSVVSHSLRPHESQHTRPPCLSPTPGVYSNSCPSSWWYHPAISSSVIPFSSCPQSLPASGSFPMSQLFTWDGQSVGVSTSASFLPMNTQDWSLLGWTGWISLPRLQNILKATVIKTARYWPKTRLYKSLDLYNRTESP